MIVAVAAAAAAVVVDVVERIVDGQCIRNSARPDALPRG